MSDTNESKLKMALVKKARATYPVDVAVFVRHENRFGSGLPDMSCTMNHDTSWWEIKHAHPGIKDTELQHITMRRLERLSFASYYIIYQESLSGERRTLIVRPSLLQQWRVSPVVAFEGFDHGAVVAFIGAVHGNAVV